MKKSILVLIACLLTFSVLGCASEEMATKQEVSAMEQALLTEIDNLHQQIDSLHQQLDSLHQQVDATKQKTPFNGDYTQLFNYALVDGKYSALSIKQDMEIPEVLVVPNRYQETEVAYTGAGLLNALPVKTVIFESGVECSYSLCGWDNNCPTLEKIVFLSEDPRDCIFTKSRYPKGFEVMLQMNDAQINGGCLIYVPDASMEAYRESIWLEYQKLLRPLSELDAETLAYIS